MEILRKIGFPYIEVLYACENFADHEENELLGSGNEHRLDQLKGAISFLDKWKTEAWNEPKALQDVSLLCFVFCRFSIPFEA